VARQLQAEASSSSRAPELEEKIAILEREKLELQKACEAKDTQLAATLAEASDAAKLKNKYSDDLAETQVCLDLAEARAVRIMNKFNKSQDNFRRYREALTTGIGYLRDEVPCLLSSHGLTALELPGPKDVEIMQFFHWFRSCLAMVESGSHLH
jgi:hypothetical protein